MGFGAKKPVSVEVPKLKIEELEVIVIGTERVVCNRWSEKAKKQMLDKQMGKAKTKKDPRDPVADYEGSLYPFPGGGYGIPCIAFKKSMVSGCRSVDGLTMTAARQAFFVVGDLVKIENAEPAMRSDMVRNDDGGADIRFRGEFLAGWRCRLRIRYNANVISAQWILLLLSAAGFGVGVLENRPEKSGDIWGTFRVANEDEVFDVVAR